MVNFDLPVKGCSSWIHYLEDADWASSLVLVILLKCVYLFTYSLVSIEIVMWLHSYQTFHYWHIWKKERERRSCFNEHARPNMTYTGPEINVRMSQKWCQPVIKNIVLMIYKSVNLQPYKNGELAWFYGTPFTPTLVPYIIVSVAQFAYNMDSAPIGWWKTIIYLWLRHILGNFSHIKWSRK